MLDKVYFDGNWIANGYFFKKCQEAGQREFAEKFSRMVNDTIPVKLVSQNIVKLDNGLECIFFGNSDGYYLVQYQYLCEVGFSFDIADSLYFQLNRENHFLFVLDEDYELLGGIMLIVLPEISMDKTEEE